MPGKHRQKQVASVDITRMINSTFRRLVKGFVDGTPAGWGAGAAQMMSTGSAKMGIKESGAAARAAARASSQFQEETPGQFVTLPLVGKMKIR